MQKKKNLGKKKYIPLTELSKCIKNKEAKLSLFGREICIGKLFSYKNPRQSTVKLLELRIEENENTRLSISVIYSSINIYKILFKNISKRAKQNKN